MSAIEKKAELSGKEVEEKESTVGCFHFIKNQCEVVPGHSAGCEASVRIGEDIPFRAGSECSASKIKRS